MGSGVEDTVIGVVVCADDTMITGEEEDAPQAERILCKTLGDLGEKVHRGNTERLIVGEHRWSYAVRGRASVRRSGTWAGGFVRTVATKLTRQEHCRGEREDRSSHESMAVRGSVWPMQPQRTETGGAADEHEGGGPTSVALVCKG